MSPADDVSPSSLRDAVSLDRALAALGIDVPRHRKIRCLWHEEDTGSLHVYQDGAYCYGGCAQQYDVFDFVMSVRGCDFPAAMREVADMAGITLPDRKGGEKPLRKLAQHAVKDAVPEPTRIVVDPRRLAVWRAIWDVLRRREIGTNGERWCESRGLRSLVPWCLGARDWQGADLRPVLKQFSPEEKAAAGLYLDRKEGAGLEPWPVLKAIFSGEPWADGVAIPFGTPDYPHPVGMRWRFLRPRNVKSAALPKSIPELMPLPVGFWRPDPFRVAGPGETFLNRWATAKRLVVCEGEPDWLSVESHLNKWMDVVAVGHCAISTGWPRAWSNYLTHFNEIVVLLHADKKPDGPASAICRSIREQLPRVKVTERLLETEAVGGMDANDLDRIGKLAPILQNVLGTP